MPPPQNSERDFPYWLLALLALAVGGGVALALDPANRQVFSMLVQGIGITLLVSIVAYIGACLLGLGLAVMVLSRRIWLRQIARFYIEVMRGVPIIVLLLYVAFVLAPALIWLANLLLEPLGLEPLRTRDFSLLWRAVLALMLAYAAFLAEIFRAGLQSVEKGQVEAALSLGLSPWQRFRLVVLPQAIRLILPPLGNDFVAMVKDSSLVAVLGVSDVTQLAKVAAAGNFRYFETYNIAAMIYLTLTLGLSLLLRRVEHHLRRRG